MGKKGRTGANEEEKNRREGSRNNIGTRVVELMACDASSDELPVHAPRSPVGSGTKTVQDLESLTLDVDKGIMQ